jgi:hypothetical protein
MLATFNTLTENLSLIFNAIQSTIELMLKKENIVQDINANIIAIFYYCPKNLTQTQREQSGECRVISLSGKSKPQG